MAYTGTFIYTIEEISNNGVSVVGSIGKIGIVKENMDKIFEIQKNLEQNPMWQEKIKKERESISATDKMNEHRIKNGYCEKCGSYCYGDCESN